MTPEELATIRIAYAPHPDGIDTEEVRIVHALLDDIDALREENARLKQAIKIMQDNWPRTIPHPMNAP